MLMVKLCGHFQHIGRFIIQIDEANIGTVPATKMGNAVFTNKGNAATVSNLPHRNQPTNQ